MLGKGGGSNNEATLIAPGAIVSGDIEFEGQLIIGGEVRGNISGRDGARSLLTVGKGGTVVGEVRVPKIEVHGTLQGDVHSDGHLRLAPTGRVIGDVYYAVMEMAQGAEVNGRLLRAGSSAGGGKLNDDGKTTGADKRDTAPIGERNARRPEATPVAAASSHSS